MAADEHTCSAPHCIGGGSQAARAGRNTKPCLVCGEEFKPRRPGNDYCSRECVNARRRQEAEAKRQRQCECCGATFVMRNPGGKARAGMAREGQYCSVACRWEHVRAKARDDRPRKPVKNCTWCGGEHTSRGSYCSDVCRNGAEAEAQRAAYWAAVYAAAVGKPPCRCRECGVTFSWFASAGKRYCSRECARRAGRRVRRSIERARLRGARVEAVDPNKVFERDGWRCCLCGRKTLKGKRGTQHPRAPELDHIVPLAQGGEHSYRNTQCACRSCNAAKSDGAGGQLRLFGLLG